MDKLIRFDKWNSDIPYETIESYKECLTKNTDSVSSFKISCGCDDAYDYVPNSTKPCKRRGVTLDIDAGQNMATSFSDFTNCHMNIADFLNPNAVTDHKPKNPKRFTIENNGEVFLNFQNITGLSVYLKLNFDQNTPVEIVEKICVNLGHSGGTKIDAPIEIENSGNSKKSAFNYENKKCKAILDKILEEEPLSLNQFSRLLSEKNSINCNKPINSRKALHIECIPEDGITITHTPIFEKPKFIYEDLEDRPNGKVGSLIIEINGNEYYFSLHNLGHIYHLNNIKKFDVLCTLFGHKKAKENQIEWTNLDPNTPRVYIPSSIGEKTVCQQALEKALLGMDIDVVHFEKLCTVSDDSEGSKFYSLICSDVDVDYEDFVLPAEDMMSFV